MAKNNTRFICTIMILVLIIIVSGVSLAYSEVSIKDYEKIKKTREFKFYISGVETGFSWANAHLYYHGGQMLYCQPPDFAMNADNDLDVLQKEIDENANKYTIDTPVEGILLQCLIKAFPCK